MRGKVSMYVEAAYLHGLPTENFDTGELEPPRDIADVAWITDKIMQLIAQSNQQAVQKALTKELHTLLSTSYRHESEGFCNACFFVDSDVIHARLAELAAAQPRKDGDENP